MDEYGDETSFSFEVDDPEEVTVNQSAFEFLNDSVFTEAASFTSDSSFSLAVAQDEPVTSTPHKPRRSSRAKKSDDAANNNFKAPKAVKQVFATCPRCRAGLKTAQTFQNHMQAHKWKDLASKIPDEKELASHCKEKFLTIIQKLGATGFAGAGGEGFRQYIEEFVKEEGTAEWSCLLKKLSAIVIESMTGVSIQKRPITFIHTIRKYVIEHINASLNNKDIQDDLIESIIRVKLCPVKVAYPFLFSLLRQMGNSALIKLCLSMSGRDPQAKYEPQIRSKDDFNHLRTKQIVHYISGSCMKGIVRHAFTYRNCQKLQRRKMCVVNRFGSFGQSAPSDPTETSYWTSLLNRKALFFVREDCLPFFLHVASVIQRLEKPDGSLGHEEVMEEVSQDVTALSLWSEIIDTELDDDESFDLLIKVVRSLTNTYGRGTLMRRMNQRWKAGKGNKGTISVSHRAKLL